ncbi:MAG: hypothetical protein ACYDDF_10890 [Thermoplasmatota archaeon]
MNRCGFLLVETEAGRERDVLARLAKLPDFQEGSVLFRSSLAVKVTSRTKSLRQTVAQVRQLGAVREARLYAPHAAGGRTGFRPT